MITLNTLLPIKDSTVNRKRTKGEKFEVAKERFDEMNKSLGGSFKLYFEVVRIPKQSKDTKDEKPKVVKRKKKE